MNPHILEERLERIEAEIQELHKILNKDASAIELIGSQTENLDHRMRLALKAFKEQADINDATSATLHVHLQRIKELELHPRQLD